MPNDERRVAHHVVEHAAALELSAPEPRHVRTAVFFGGAREIWAAGGRGASCPNELSSRFDLRREQLVLEIARRESHALHQFAHALRLGDVARERLLARETDERALATLDRVDDLLDVLDARVIGPGQPDR